MASFSRSSAPLVPKGGKVCIIGGGTTGLLAARNSLDEGLQPTVFERTDRVGGVWRLDEAPDRVAYDSLYTNGSGCMMSISDFPMKDSLQGHFPGRQDICDYYEAYVSKFGLQEHIKFGTEVVSVSRSEGGSWSVSVAHGGDKSHCETYDFDAVFVCTGQFHDPAVPRIPGTDKFKGRVSHSAAYRNADNLKGRSVVVVGIGNSALDISLEAARAGCKSVVMLCRSGTNVLSVADFYGRPADQMLNTRLFSSLPQTMRNLLFFWMFRGTNDWFRRHGMPAPGAQKENKDMGFANLKEHVAYRQMLEAGRIRIRPGGVHSLGEESLRTTEGEDIAADEVILCTGYHLSFPFLAPDISATFLAETAGRRHLNAYRLIMHPTEPTLCALSFLLTFGNESCVGEMQARWALGLWCGRVPMPHPEQIEADLRKRRSGSKYPQFVPYVTYMDALAADCGVKPTLSWTMLLQRPWLYWKLQAGPVVPSQYRLAGAHKLAQAADFISAQPPTFLRWVELLLAPPHSSRARPAMPPPAARL